MIVNFLKKVLYLIALFILFYVFIYFITKEIRTANIFTILFSLIAFLIISVIMYFKGLREIKKNNFNSLFFSIFPNILMRILFIHDEYERNSVFFRKEREKRLENYLEDFDDKMENNYKLQMAFYTLCYAMLLSFIVHAIFYMLSNYYGFTSNITSLTLKIFYLIILIMVILMSIVVAKKSK